MLNRVLVIIMVKKSVLEFIKKKSLSTWIIVGMVLGVCTGIFFGESCKDLKIIGDIFINLLQMTILPYIITSLILGIGSLNFHEARNLALRGGMLLFLFWGTILGTVFLMPLVFPEMNAASFFSSSMVAELPKPDYLKLYIPSNPFSSMASSMIPAVVLFALCLGVALIGIKEKEPLLHVLSISKDALIKVARGVAYLTPIGVFSFAANAAGTLTMEQFAQLQVFFVTYMTIAIILTFILFPLLVSVFTPFSMKEVISYARAALVTAFTTGNLFIVLPMITEKVKALLATRADKDDNENLPDIIIPVTFNFPDAGQLSFLSFILFASWFAGSLLPVARYPELGFTGLLSFFGGANLAIPYLLDSYKLSTDYFQLYMVAGIVNGYFATMAASMQLVCFTVICSFWMSGKSHFSLKRLLVNGSFSFGFIALLMILVKIYLAMTTQTTLSQKSVLDGMKIKNPVEFSVSKIKDDRSLLTKIFQPKNRSNRLQKIKSNKLLRVGFNPNTMPFCFYNSKKELIGYDIQMANYLADTLNCKIEFVPFDMDDLTTALENNVFDIAMTGVYVGLSRIDKLDFTDSYMEINPAIIVKDYDKKRFHDLASVQAAGKVKIAVLKGSLFSEGIKKVFKDAEIISVDNYSDFFTGKVKADMLVHSAEQGYTWTLLYPDYSVIILKELNRKTRVAYAIAKGDLPFLTYLNYWLNNMKLNNITDVNYDYWILGHVPELKKPRWCIARDVLHWMD
jgi:Na+/H+-dicarboxylate symporter/ABC-type amino acid transport substrate-binding protein